MHMYMYSKKEVSVHVAMYLICTHVHWYTCTWKHMCIAHYIAKMVVDVRTYSQSVDVRTYGTSWMYVCTVVDVHVRTDTWMCTHRILFICSCAIWSPMQINIYDTYDDLLTSCDDNEIPTDGCLAFVRNTRFIYIQLPGQRCEWVPWVSDYILSCSEKLTYRNVHWFSFVGGTYEATGSSWAWGRSSEQLFLCSI